MKRCRTIGALALIAVFIGVCVPISTNPLSDPKTAAVDDRLVGRWSATKGVGGAKIAKEAMWFVDFVRQEDGMTDVLIVMSHEEEFPPIPDLKLSYELKDQEVVVPALSDLLNGGDGGGPEAEMVGEQQDPVGGLAKPLIGPGTWYAFRMFPSRIAGHAFMNLRLIAPEEGQGDFRGGYLLARYEITEKDELTVWLLDDKGATAAIKSGLAGDVKRGRWTSEVTIVTSTEEWVSYVQTIDPARLFGMEYATFQRIK